ncbi:MAG: gliding motility-associated C-terminal domain-containing protein [Bacteroidota bacterium]|nr:gliding motility-associated C-terminal domain-containing protein [Bacteroidota bacterium]
MPKILLTIFFLCLVVQVLAQGDCPISSLGQNPGTAFPVCGVKEFTQGSVNLCGVTKVPVPACNGSTAYTNINPYWYKFTCYKTGTLGFLITPTNLGDDYDWQIFDITGHDPNEVFSNTSLFVCCNWSGVTGLTGTSDTASSANQCASATTYAQGGVSPFSQMPTLQVGHTYLLLVSHYTNTQSGYNLAFNGGTASITDPTNPGYIQASGICGGDKVYIKLNKQLQCKSIAADGSDFTLSPANVTVQSATGYGCSSGFDTDSIIVQLNNPLSPGNYSIVQQQGTDGNTLLDNCFNAVPVGTNAGFSITSQQLIKAGFTYQLLYGCKTDTINFTLGGQNVVNWTWYFDNQPVQNITNPTLYYKTFGAKNIKLVVQNSVCTDSTSSTITLNNAPLKASFDAPAFACPSDTVHFTSTSIGNIQYWFWDFGNGQTSMLETPEAQRYPVGSALKNYPVRLSVTDSIGCSDTTYHIIQVAPNCYIAVPSAFTPNGDGLNDYLYPLNAYKAQNLTFRVYNRFGQMIFETHDWTNKWDGTFKGLQQAAGTYIWTLDYLHPDTGQRIFQKGTTVLIR